MASADCPGKGGVAASGLNGQGPVAGIGIGIQGAAEGKIAIGAGGVIGLDPNVVGELRSSCNGDVTRIAADSPGGIDVGTHDSQCGAGGGDVDITLGVKGLNRGVISIGDGKGIHRIGGSHISAQGNIPSGSGIKGEVPGGTGRISIYGVEDRDVGIVACTVGVDLDISRKRNGTVQ